MKSKNPDELELFQFPTKFIHPALMYNQEAFSCIMKWFENYCNYAHVIKVIGHRLLMKSSEIQELQENIRLKKDEIKNQMKLTAKPKGRDFIPTCRNQLAKITLM